MGIIYCYTNKITGTKYIGQTINPQERYNQHKSSAYNPKDIEYNSTFHKKIREYGWENFNYEILQEIEDNTKLDEAEKYWIAYYDSYHNGYNMTPGGRGKSGPMSDETKEKLSLIRGELTKEEVIAIRKAYANHESPTQYYNEHYKDQMHFNSFLNIWTGKKYKTIMPEVIENGRHSKLNQELADKIREEYKNGNVSYQILADKYKIGKCTVRDVVQGKTWNKDNDIKPIKANTNKKKIKCIETQKIYNSIIEAAKDIHKDQSGISKCLNGKTKTCGGYHWVFVNE